MTDIVDRLREQGEWRNDKAWDGCPIAEEAADEITHLREENARLREALKELIEDHEYMTDTDAEEDNLARAHARAAIREGGNE